MRLKYKVGMVVLALLAGCLAASAEEITLKNGQKIVGKIVGYENDMFRVETDYGFALVKKESIVNVNFGPGGKSEGKGEQGDRSPRRPRGPAVTPEPAPAAPPKLSLEPEKPAPVSRPLDQPLPAQLQEHMEGNQYVNDTFHFAMYKPSDWKLYEGVSRETRSAIVAIGTQDEQTVLFVDRQVWSGTPVLDADRAEARLRATYQEYQKLSESSVEVDHHPAVRRIFRGVLDGAEWHGVSVHVAQGNTVFGIIGLTSAESFQFQQAVLNKIINTFHFLDSQKPVANGR